LQNIVKTLLLDPDHDEKDTELLNNPTIANPTNRLPILTPSKNENVKDEKVAARPIGYSLRSCKRRVNYREKSVSVESSVASRKMSVASSMSFKEEEEEEMIDTSSKRLLEVPFLKKKSSDIMKIEK